MSKMNTQRRAVTTLVIFVAILLGPFLYAQHAFHHANPQTIKTKNYGELIRPPLLLESLAFSHTAEMTEKLNHHWGLVLVNTTGECDAVCEKALYHMTQIHQLLHKHQNRLQRFVWTTGKNTSVFQALLSQGYLGVPLLTLDTFDPALFPENQSSSLVIVDPLGNVILRYSLDADPSKVLKDIKHLIAVSQIG